MQVSPIVFSIEVTVTTAFIYRKATHGRASDTATRVARFVLQRSHLLYLHPVCQVKSNVCALAKALDCIFLLVIVILSLGKSRL